MDIKDLVGLKLALLLHDPPNKMWVSAHRKSHEEVASEFAKGALGETTLEKLYRRAIENFKELVSRADATAASFDRWLLVTSRHKADYYVHYKNLHNIFNPTLYTKLDVEGLKSPVEDWRSAAASVNLLLRSIEDHVANLRESERAVLLYNVFYAILEPIWYYQGLPPSLADTRTPTHTVFDHLYASASLANIVGDTGFSGYYVVLDYPGVQKFVLAGRKAGDFWASSWVLSNVMWRTALEYARKYGFDVILTPTPRLNPYTFRSLLAMITGRGSVDGFYEITCSELPEEQLKEPLKESVCKMLTSLYGIDQVEPGGLEELDVLLHQPLIPATITMLLPSIVADTPERLANDMLEAFKRSWKELYDFVEKSLKDMASRTREGGFIAKFLLKSLQSVKSVLELPPHGIRVFIVRVEPVYRDLETCIVEGKQESCEKVGLLPNSSVLHDVGSGEPGVQKKLFEELPRRLLYYVLVTRWSTLVRYPEYGYYVVPVPRSFSYYDPCEESIKHVIEHETTCSLCGEEPAVLKLGKKFDSKSRGILTYDDEAVKTIQETLKNDPVTADQRVELSKILKPGEALGPYCLLKRAAYQVFRDKLGILSTDDVALLRISRIAKNRRKAFNATLERVEKTRENGERLIAILKHLYEYEYRNLKTSIKDIESSANALGYSFDKFVEVANESIIRACVDALSNASNELLEIAVEAYNFERGISLQLRAIKTKLPRGIVEELCKIVTIPTSYAIVRGDADNIGKLLRGAPLECSSVRSYLLSYFNSLYNEIAKQGEIRVPSDVDRESVLQELRQGYERYVSVVEALGLDSVLVSPSWHSAVSLSLVLSAIEDYKISRELDGILVYTGGDDVLAFYPVHTALSAAREYRERFTGDGFKRVCRKIPVTSSLMTGRSFSVRFVNLKDIMSEEANLAFEQLEELAKNAEWSLLNGKWKWKKDSLVVSDSRAGIEAVLPQRVKMLCDMPVEESIYTYIDSLLLALVLDVVSRNLPEDLDSFIEGYGVDLERGLGDITAYILRRNLKSSGERVLDGFVATNLLPVLRRTVHEVSGSIGKEKINLALESYSKLFRILRRHVG